jgi:hypothetical protein
MSKRKFRWYSVSGRNLLQAAVYINGRRERFAFPRSLKKDLVQMRLVEDFFLDLEDSCRTGGALSEASREFLRRLMTGNPRLYAKLQTLGVIDGHSAKKSTTLKEAFEDYIRANYTNPRTISNWRNTAKKLYAAFGEDKPLVDITLKEMTQLFGSLRRSEDNPEGFKPITLQKDVKNVRQLWRSCLDMGDIPSDPMTKLRFKLKASERSEDKPVVEESVFLQVLAAVPGKQQKAVLACYRWLGARTSDMDCNLWEDVRNLETARPTILRGDIKKGTRLEVPIPTQLIPFLRAWRDEVLATKGELSGLLFPWLTETSKANQYSQFLRWIDKAGVPRWRYLRNALRSTRTKEVRRAPNGNYLEQKVIGHSSEIADIHYDGLMDRDFNWFWEGAEAEGSHHALIRGVVASEEQK